MLGERLSAVDIGVHGVIGDRAYALREANGRVVTAKKWANMFEFCASYDAPPTPGALGLLRITLPDGRTIHAQDPDQLHESGETPLLHPALQRASPQQDCFSTAHRTGPVLSHGVCAAVCSPGCRRARQRCQSQGSVTSR